MARVSSCDSFLRLSSVAAMASFKAEAISLAKESSAVKVELIG